METVTLTIDGKSVTVEKGKSGVEAAARKLGLPITLHTSGPTPIQFLEDNGLLGPDVQFVHPLLTTAEERRLLKLRGCSYSTSPVAESRRPAKRPGHAPAAEHHGNIASVAFLQQR